MIIKISTKMIKQTLCIKQDKKYFNPTYQHMHQ